MKRLLTSILLFSLILFSLVSCSVGKPEDTASLASTATAAAGDTKTESTTAGLIDEGTSSDPVEGTSSDSVQPTSEDAAAQPLLPTTGTEATTAGGESTVAGTNPANGNLTLESLKKTAQDAGYTVQDNTDLPQRLEPSPIKGFLIDYKDESLQTSIPVYEFSSPEDAEKFAEQVNRSGYNLCIVTGKYLSLADSKYGILTNDKEKALLEDIFGTGFMAYVASDSAPAATSMDYTGAASRISAISKALDLLVNKSVFLYAKTLPADDPDNIGNVSFSMLSSADLSFTSAFSEEKSGMDAVAKLWENYGCTDVKVKHNAPYHYVLSGKRAGADTTFEIICTYNPEKDSLRIVDKDGGRLAEFFEFVPVGTGKYSVQTMYERAILEYKDGKITSLVYSLKERLPETAYDPARDSIYPDAAKVDTAWVSKLGQEKYEQFITFDGSKLKISARSFTGKQLTAELETK